MNSKRRYKFSYQTILTYQAMVTRYHFLLRCTPTASQQQQLIDHLLHLLAPAKIDSDEDAFGNTIHYGYLNEGHDLFVVASNGIVECEKYILPATEESIKPYYKVATHLSLADKAISDFNKSTHAQGNALEVTLQLSEALFARMEYQPGVTSVDTTAAKSFEMGCGVCQDLAHILLSMCRERDIAARYVVGLVVGTGQTHAWVEVWCNGAWWGVDPTHNKFIEWGYIKLAHGRDAADCSVVRGVKHGLSNLFTQVRVVVEEI